MSIKGYGNYAISDRESEGIKICFVLSLSNWIIGLMIFV